jgi:hypothetical protein
MADETIPGPDCSSRILEYLSQHKKGSHRAIKEALGMSDPEYERGMTQLLSEGKVFRRRCRGGGLRLAEEITLPEVDEAQLDAAKKDQERVEQEVAVAAERAEKDLYPYVQQWATNEGFDRVAIVGDNHRRAPWENPDLLALVTNNLEWMVGTDIEVVSIEVKLAFDVGALWQTAHYRTFSHYVYLACYEKPEDLRSKAEGRLYEMAVELGIGILSLTPAGAGARGVRCVEINSPNRQYPRVVEVDSLLGDYADILGIEKPGKRLIAQMQDATLA